MKALSTIALALTLCFAFVFSGGAQRNAEDIPDGYARLLVITNFENTEVSLNDVSYPYEYIYADRQGVLVPANMPILLKVSVSEEKTRRFRLNLKSGEMRVVVVDIAQMGEVTAVPTAPAAPTPSSDGEEEEEEATTGYLGVSSSPRGVVYIDENSPGRRTPARRIELEPGRHRVQIQYDSSGEMSETKYVLIRAGTNTNVFFRQRPTN